MSGPYGQGTSSKPSETSARHSSKGDDSGDLRSLGGIEVVREYPPHVRVYRMLSAREHAAATPCDAGYYLPAVAGILRAGDKSSLLERAERGSDRLGCDALDIGQLPGCERSKTVQPYQHCDLKKPGIGCRIRRGVELADPPTDSTHRHAQVNRAPREVSGCLSHSGNPTITKSRLPNLTYQRQLWYPTAARRLRSRRTQGDNDD